MTDSQLVIEAGRRRGVRSIKTGRPIANLQAMALRHARYMAKHQWQQHQHWDARYAELVRTTPEYRGFVEIVAQSWPWNNREQAAAEMFNSWRQSPGHWRVANGICDAYGYSMAVGTNGIWYGAGITARKR